MTQFDSTDDQRIDNNTMRHQYRTLSDDEKALVNEIKDAGGSFEVLISQMPQGREAALARTKIEEAIMWAVKGITK